MKLLVPYCLFCLILSTPLYAGSETLVTYYPAPSGNYNKISANYMRLGTSTLSAAQAQYKCSYDPKDGYHTCPAGLVFYNTDAHTLFFSDGTHWRSVNASCIPLTPCSASLNCGTDDCGYPCGVCSGQSRCSSSTAGIAGTCG